jgi:hypothetical protein
MVSRNYTYTVNELIEFIEKYFGVSYYKQTGNILITTEFLINDTDIELIIKYFDTDMKVFDIAMYTFAGGWENKRSSMIIEMDVCEKENKYTYWLQTPDKPYIDRYQLKSEGQLDEITKEEIFGKINEFFNLTCKKEQLRDIKLTELGIK